MSHTWRIHFQGGQKVIQAPTTADALAIYRTRLESARQANSYLGLQMGDVIAVEWVRAEPLTLPPGYVRCPRCQVAPESAVQQGGWLAYVCAACGAKFKIQFGGDEGPHAGEEKT